MTVLPQLERDLVDAAEKRLARAASSTASTRYAVPRQARQPSWLRPRGLRLALLLTACLLVTATAGLAASGVLLTGSPVPPSGTTNPRFGLGVPTHDGTRLLPLRIPDPEGGPPWGMRIVETTRGESCIQLGRVHDGQLGVLGMDGAFHDDGLFHPIPVDALPTVAGDGGPPTTGAYAKCRLPGKAIAGETYRVDRNGSDLRYEAGVPLPKLRDISYGILGPDARKVSYEQDGKIRTETVVPGLGAYLIVQRSSRSSANGGGIESLGTYGRLQASGAVTAITYLLEGKLCERGRPRPGGAKQNVPNKCPFFHVKPTERPPAKMPQLREKLNVHLSIRKHAVIALHVSFAAPYAIHSAKWEYRLEVPSCTRLHGGPHPYSTSVIYPNASLQRDVAKGAKVHLTIPDPFAPSACRLRPLTVEAIYRHAESPTGTVVGSATVSMPPGDKPFDAKRHSPRGHHSARSGVIREPRRVASPSGEQP